MSGTHRAAPPRSRRLLGAATAAVLVALGGVALGTGLGPGDDDAGPTAHPTPTGASPDPTVRNTASATRATTAEPAATPDAPSTPTSDPSRAVTASPSAEEPAPPTEEPAPSATEPSAEEPTATPAPTPTPPGEDPPPPPSRFPDETTTGVPPGTVLTPSGSLTIVEDGTVIDGLEITGTVTVHADDVVIRRSVIRNTGEIPIRLIGNDLLVEDSEIDGQGKGNPAIGYNDYVLRRVHIHDVAEGPRIAGGDVVIEDSLVHRLVQVGSNHTDAIQIVGGDNITIRRNTVLSHDAGGSGMGNAALQFGEEDGPVYDCVVEGNLFGGGHYTVNGGGGGTTGARCEFRDNRFLRTATYGAMANLGPGVVWERSNVWHATGGAV